MTDAETTIRQAIIDALPRCTYPSGDVDIDRLLTEVYDQLPDDQETAARALTHVVMRLDDPALKPVQDAVLKEFVGERWLDVIARDYGDSHLSPGLHALLAQIEAERQATPEGRRASRLYEAAMAAHPDFIAKPNGRWGWCGKGEPPALVDRFAMIDWFQRTYPAEAAAIEAME